MDSDRDLWNQRYLDGFYSDRQHPTQLLADWIELLPTGRALDVACGSGRNTVFLADQGYQVLGLDIADVALEQAKSKQCKGLVEFQAVDLEEDLPDIGTFDLIVLVRYVNLPLMQRFADYLNPNGALLIEQHLHWPDTELELSGPKNPNFRLDPGTLKSTFNSMQVLYEKEGLITEPGGGTAAISQLVAQLAA